MPIITTLLRASLISSLLASFGFPAFQVKGQTLPNTAYYQTASISNRMIGLTPYEFDQAKTAVSSLMGNRRTAPLRLMGQLQFIQNIIERGMQECGGFTREYVMRHPHEEIIDIQRQAAVTCNY